MNRQKPKVNQEVQRFHELRHAAKQARVAILQAQRWPDRAKEASQAARVGRSVIVVVGEVPAVPAPQEGPTPDPRA